MDATTTSARKHEVLAWEAKWAKPVACASIAAAIGVVAYLVIAAKTGAPTQLTARSTAANATEWTTMGGTELGILLLKTASALLLIPALYFLFRATDARTDNMRRAWLPFVFLGPVIAVIQSVLVYLSSKSIASDFVDQVGTRTGEAADDFLHELVSNSDFISIANLAIIPTLIAMIAGFLYVSVQSLKAGLLTRFWGTFGMAVSVGVVFLGTLGVTLWVAYVGLLAVRLVHPPPAWDAVEAIPWPVGGRGPDGAAVNDPSAIPGDGREIDVGEDAAGDAGDAEPEADPHNPPLPEGAAPRKRKRRG